MINTKRMKSELPLKRMIRKQKLLIILLEYNVKKRNNIVNTI